MKKFMCLILSVILSISVFAPISTFAASNRATTLPAAVKLSSAKNNVSGVMVTWKKVNKVTSYKVYRKASNEKSWTALGTTSGTSYIDKTAKSGVKYTYTVRAKNSNGWGGYDKKGVSVNYLAAPKFSVSSSSSEVNIKWSKVGGAKQYRVYRKANGDKNWTTLATISKLSYADKKVKSNKSYTYAVRALNGKNSSAYSTVKINCLGIPNVTSIKSTSNAVKLDWTKVLNAKSYKVYRKATGDKNWTTLGTTTKLSYTDKKATSGKTYSYAVRAYNGNSASSYKSVKIMFLSQPEITSAKATGDSISISWKKVGGAQGYRIYRKNENGKKWTLLGKTSYASFEDITALSGNTYSYTVRAFNGSYSSDYDKIGALVSMKPLNWSKEQVFNFYKKSCDSIKNDATAGFTRKEWQEVKSFDLGSASSILQPILQGFMKTEDQAEAKTSAKGSDDAKRRMAPCGADISYVKSATKQDLANGNYKITIIMNDENTPAKGSNGIASMSTGILYVEDVQDTVKNDSTVNKIVKSLDKAEIVYKAYTIVAEMTKDGKFVSIDHNTVGNISADCKLVVGSASGTGTLAFTSKWYDFKY